MYFSKCLPVTSYPVITMKLALRKFTNLNVTMKQDQLFPLRCRSSFYPIEVMAEGEATTTKHQGIH
jgi:hypothetical protein